MRVMVTGASGFVGRHLLARLRDTGNTAIGLSRGGDARDGTFGGPADLADIGTWPEWPHDIDAVVHLAALNPRRGSRIDRATLDHANADATQALAERCVREGVRRLVFVSTALIHRPATAKPFDEDSFIAPQNAYAASKLEAEGRLWAALKESTTEGCIVRPVPVFGIGGRGMIAALLKLAQAPLPLPLQGVGGARSIISVENLVDALLLCLSSTRAAGQTFLVAGDEPLTPADIVTIYRDALGRRGSVLPIPARLLGVFAAAFGKNDVWRTLNAPFAADTTRIRRALDWHQTTTTREALRQLALNLSGNR